MSATGWLAFAAGGLGAIAALELARAATATLRSRAPVVAGAVAGLADAIARAGRDGRDPGTAERRRLLAAGTVSALAFGMVLAGPLVGAALGAGTPWLVGRALRERKARYRRAVERGGPAMALALADALSGGHSLRGGLQEAAVGLDGPPGRELRRVAAEIRLGARTDDALEAMRTRVRSPAVDAIVAAALLHRRVGGDLARVLRDAARSFEDWGRLEDEVREATAQARFTGLLVVLLPIGGGLLAELASPGYLRGLAGSALTAWLVGLAVALQAVAAVAIRRLGRVRG